MRISTSDAYESGIAAITARQSELRTLQDQLATGKRVDKASDDPAAAARAERALAGMRRSDASQRALNASRNATTQTESAYADAGALMQQARETLVAAGNASYGDAERKALSQQLQAVRSQLLGVANRTDGADGYLFAGQSSAQQPFADAPGGVRYTATPGTMTTGAGVDMPLSADGAAAWTSARTGNGVFETAAGPMVAGAVIDNGRVADPSLLTDSTYTLAFGVTGGAATYSVLRDGAATTMVDLPYQAGKDIVVDGMSFSISGTPAAGDTFTVAPSTPTLSVFGALDKAIADLAAPRRTGSQIAQAVSDNLRNVDAVMTTLQASRAASGDALNRIDSESERIATQKLGQETQRADAEALDLVAAYSSFQALQTGYDAALKSYSTVQRMSLFDYLG